MQHRRAKRFEVVRDVLHPVVRGPSLKPCHRCSRLLCWQVIDAAPQCRGSASLLLGGSNSAQTVCRGHRWEPGRRTGGSTRHSPVCGPRGRRGKAPHYWPCSSDGDEAKHPAAHAGEISKKACCNNYWLIILEQEILEQAAYSLRATMFSNCLACFCWFSRILSPP